MIFHFLKIKLVGRWSDGFHESFCLFEPANVSVVDLDLDQDPHSRDKPDPDPDPDPYHRDSDS